MAFGSQTGRIPAFTFLPVLASLMVAMLIITVLAAGSRPNFGDTISFIKVDATHLSIVPKLSGSQFLTDISKVSGSDLVGQVVTPLTLQISLTYYITLLGACGHGNGDTVCSPRRIGYIFDPRTDLKLDSTSLAGTFSDSLNSTLNSYAKVSSFLGVAYVFALALATLAPIASVLSSRFGRAGIAGAVMSCTATVCLLAASIAATVTFKNVDGAINSEFSSIGVSSEVGMLIIPSWVAFAFSLLTSIMLNIRTSKPVPGHGGSLGFSAKGPTPGIITGNRAMNAKLEADGMRPLGLLKRVQTWGQHKYVQLGAPPTAKRGARSRTNEYDDDTALIYQASPEMEPKSLQESGIAMVPLHHNGDQDMNQAYEPYTGRAM